MSPVLSVIQTQNLSKNYGNFQALQSLNLNVPANSIVGFLGPNGAGKSTTIKLLLGLTKPTDGSGTIFGMDIVKENQDIRRRVGYLAQNPNFYEHMSARQIMDFTVRFFFRGPHNLIRERIDETLKLVGLDDKADRPVRGFSGGERQRLGIAQAQVNYPDLLILDEPAAALDPQGRRDVLEVMEKLRKHTTIFFSTHILDDVQRVSDRVIILNHGELIAQGSVEELLSASPGLNYRLVLKGDASRAQQHLQSFSWVQDIVIGHQNGKTAMTIMVKDE
ncbi:MAG: ABC transporter ATP-binding protein, partial [Anaerolineaceae bacterium]|nr:ABC transporter ATP-binding protein [Anaerolineaceae bacterium]